MKLLLVPIAFAALAASAKPVSDPFKQGLKLIRASTKTQACLEERRLLADALQGSRFDTEMRSLDLCLTKAKRLKAIHKALGEAPSLECPIPGWIVTDDGRGCYAPGHKPVALPEQDPEHKDDMYMVGK